MSLGGPYDVEAALAECASRGFRTSVAVGDRTGMGAVASSGSSQTTDDECAKAGAAKGANLLE